MRGAHVGVPDVAILGEDARFQERLHHRQNAFIPDPSPHPVHQGRVVDLVEAGLDVAFHHPLIGAAGEVVGLGDRVMRSALRAEPIGTRAGNPPRRSAPTPASGPLGRPDPATVGIPKRRRLAVPGFGIIRSRTGSGRKLRSFSSRPQLVEEDLDPSPGLHRGGGISVHPGRARALVAPHPSPRHQQERGIGHEIEQIIEPAIRIVGRPTVQLGLDLQYPAFRLEQGVLQSRRYSPATSRHCSILPAGLLVPFAMHEAFPRSDYYETSAPPTALSRRRACPPGQAGRPSPMGDRRRFPRSPHDRSARSTPSYYPDSIATATPQAFTMASPPAGGTRLRS